MIYLSSSRSLYVLCRVSILLRLGIQRIHCELGRCYVCLKLGPVVAHFYLQPAFPSIALSERLLIGLLFKIVRSFITVVEVRFINPSNPHAFLTSSISSSTEFGIPLCCSNLMLLSSFRTTSKQMAVVSATVFCESEKNRTHSLKLILMTFTF